MSLAQSSSALSLAQHARIPWVPWVFAVALAVLLAVRPPLAGACFGFVDDYVLLDAARPVPDWPFLGWLSRDGRPLYGILLNIVLVPMRDVCDLGLLRLANVALEAVIATQLFALAVRHDWPVAAAGALALVVLALPGFAVAATWATLIGPLAAMALALAAAALVLPHPGTGRPSLVRASAAACLLAAALSLYQPGAMAFLAGLAIALVRAPATADTLRRILVPSAVVFVAVMVAYAVFFLLVPFAVHGGVSTRAALTLDPWHKLIWFLGVPLRQAINLYNLEPVPRFGLAVLAVVALGTMLRHRDVAVGLLSLAVQAVLVVLAFLPNLAVAESWPAFRSSLPMAMTLAVLVAAAILFLGEALPRRLAAVAGPSMLLLLGAWGLAASATAAERGIVRLQREEWRLLLDSLRQLAPPEAGRPAEPVLLVPAFSVPGCLAWQRFDEFGLPSTARPWAAQAMLRHGWRQVHGEAPSPRFIVLPPGEPPPADAEVIDVAARLAGRSQAICGS